jgi:hypothetical protein
MFRATTGTGGRRRERVEAVERFVVVFRGLA